MEELLKIAYRNFLNNEEVETSKSAQIMNEHWKGIEDALGRLEDILSEKLFVEIYNLIADGAADVQEAAFIAGFAYCAKFLTNGKTDLLPND